MDNERRSFYNIEGGALTLDVDAPYVVRDADEKLHQFAQIEQSRSRVCFILAPRQVGKSSLMVRTVSRLTTNNFVCVQINLQDLGEVESARELWYSLLVLTCQQVQLPDVNLVEQLNTVWGKTPDLSPTMRFRTFLIQEILSKINSKKLIIFVDEIQVLRKWKFQDSSFFIGTIKALSDNRNEPSLQNLGFVLLGVAKPSDLVTDYTQTLNLGVQIELGNLTRDFEPLLKGLEPVTSDPAKVLDSILHWTGGQPFLTQVLCNMVATGCIIEDVSSVKHYIGELVSEKIIRNWRSQDKQLHLQTIENWFIKVDTSQKLQKLAAIRLYRQILKEGTFKFCNDRVEHWDLLISGIVAKEDERLKVANPIYEQVFDPKWVQEKEDFLQEGIMADKRPNIEKIYSRDVFMLLDQSGSMVRTDGRENKRWKLLEERVMAHVDAIFEAGKEKGEPICEEIVITTFNVDEFKSSLYSVTEPSQVEDIFLENRPTGNTFVVPALIKCRQKWLKGREKLTVEEVNNGAAKGAFFIIYTDGQFDDREAFEEFLKNTCLRVDDSRIFRIIILGIGKDVNVKYFDDVHYNIQENKDSRGQKCNVVIFDLADNEPNLIDMMRRLKPEDMENPNLLRKGSRHRQTLEQS